MNFKKFFAIVMVCTSIFCAKAVGPDFLGIANHVGVDVGIGTTGISIEAATPLTKFVQARLGVDIMPGLSFTDETDVNFVNPVTGGIDYSSMDLKAGFGRFQGHLIFNLYPLGHRFPLFIAAGAYLGGKDFIKFSGHSEDLKRNNGYIEIGDYQLPVDANGNVKGALRTNSFRPYLGIGTGRPCPGGRVAFMWELGVQFQKKPYLWDDLGNKKIDVATFSSDDSYQNIMDHLVVYPVLKFTISGRIF